METEAAMNTVDDTKRIKMSKTVFGSGFTQHLVPTMKKLSEALNNPVENSQRVIKKLEEITLQHSTLENQISQEKRCVTNELENTDVSREGAFKLQPEEQDENKYLEYKVLQEENSQLSTELKDVQGDCEKLTLRIQQLEYEKQKYLLGQEQQNQEKNELEELVRQLKQEKEDFKRDQEKTTQELQTTQEKIQELEDREARDDLGKMMMKEALWLQDKEAMSRKLDKLHEETCSMQKKIDKLSDDKETLQQKLTAAEATTEFFKLNQGSPKANSAVETLKRELETVKTQLNYVEEENTLLKERKETEIKGLATQLDELSAFKLSYGELKHAHERLRRDYDKQKEEFEKQKTAMQETMKHYNNKLQEVQKARNELTEKLSTEWGHKVAADESNIENINIKHRPINIADDYSELCTNQWFDAKEAIDEACTEASEEEKKKFLCQILLLAEKLADSKHQKVLNIIGNTLEKPIETLHHLAPQYLPCKHITPVRNGIHKEVQCQLWMDTVKPSTCSCGNRVEEDRSAEDVEQDQQEQTAKQIVHQHPESPLVNSDSSVHTPNIQQRNLSPTHKNSRLPGASNPGVDTAVTCKPEVPLSSQLTTAISDHFRDCVDRLQVGDLVNELKIRLLSAPKWVAIMAVMQDNTLMETYLEASALLAWKMTIQRPPMTFHTKGLGKQWDEKIQEATLDGADPTHAQSRVAYYTHPVLLHGDKVMVKGRVFMQKKLH